MLQLGPLLLLATLSPVPAYAPPQGPASGVWEFAAAGTDTLGWAELPTTGGMSLQKNDGEDYLRCGFGPDGNPFKAVIRSDDVALVAGQDYLVMEFNLTALAEVSTSVPDDEITVRLNWDYVPTVGGGGHVEFAVRPNLGWQTIAVELTGVFDDGTRPAYVHPLTAQTTNVWAAPDIELLRLRLGADAGDEAYLASPEHSFRIRSLRLTDAASYRSFLKERYVFAEYIGKQRQVWNPNTSAFPQVTHWSRIDPIDDDSELDAEGEKRRKLMTWLGDTFLATGVKNVAPTLSPVIGFYDDSRRTTAEYHLLLAKIAGVDGLFHEWFPEDDPNQPVSVPEEALVAMQQVQFAYNAGELGPVVPQEKLRLISTTHAATHLGGETDPPGLDPIQPKDIADDLHDMFTGQAVEFDGREIFNLADAWSNDYEITADELDEIADEYLQSYGKPAAISLLTPEEPYAATAEGIGEWMKNGTTWRLDKDLLGPNPAGPPSGVGGPLDPNGYYPGTHYASVDDQVADLLESQAKTRSWVRDLGGDTEMVLFGSVLAGFDDTRSHSWGTFSNKRFSENVNGDKRLIEELFNAVLAQQLRVAYLASWNGFKEGHVVEPTRERGYADLEYLAEAFAGWKTNPLCSDPPTPADLANLRRFLRVPERVHELRVSLAELEDMALKAGASTPVGLTSAGADLDAVVHDLLGAGEFSVDIVDIETRLDGVEADLSALRLANVASARLALRWDHDDPAATYGLARSGGVVGAGADHLVMDPGGPAGADVASFAVDWSYAVPGLGAVGVGLAGVLLSGSFYDATVAFEYLDAMSIYTQDLDPAPNKNYDPQRFDYLDVESRFVNDDAQVVDRRLAQIRGRVIDYSSFPGQGPGVGSGAPIDPSIWAQTEVEFHNALVQNGEYIVRFEANERYDGESAEDGLRWLEVDGLAHLWLSGVTFSPASAAGTPTLSWLRSLGGEGSEYVHDVAVSGDRVYVAGEFHGDFAVGGVTLTDRGRGDAFLAAYDLGGNLQWITQGGGEYADRALQVDVVASDRVELIAQTYHDTEFGSATGTGAAVATFAEHCFVKVTYDALGRVLDGATPATVQGDFFDPSLHVNVDRGVAVHDQPLREYGLSPGAGAHVLHPKRYQVYDASQAATIRAGRFKETLRLVSSPTEVRVLQSHGRSDAYVAEFPDGTGAAGSGDLAAWTVSLGGEWNDWATAVDLTDDGASLVVVGVFHGKLASPVAIEAPGYEPNLGSNSQVFIAKYDLATP